MLYVRESAMRLSIFRCARNVLFSIYVLCFLPPSHITRSPTISFASLLALLRAVVASLVRLSLFYLFTVFCFSCSALGARCGRELWVKGKWGEKSILAKIYLVVYDYVKGEESLEGRKKNHLWSSWIFHFEKHWQWVMILAQRGNDCRVVNTVVLLVGKSIFISNARITNLMDFLPFRFRLISSGHNWGCNLRKTAKQKTFLNNRSENSQTSPSSK